jgi:formate dehydrogenase subunit beta
VGAVLRSCELRALVELVKLQQASLDSLTLIAIDCAGTYSVPVFRQKDANRRERKGWLDLYQAAEQEPGNPDIELRQSCRICDQPIFSGAQISIELFGSHLEQEIGLSLPDELGERLCLKEAGSNGRAQVIENLVAARITSRDNEFAAIRLLLEGEGGLAGVFDACLRCHNCMNACPICYCKTCVFKSQIFDHDPIHYLQQAASKGACRLPADTLLFHLTRLNHMALSCVGCGLCTAACPADLPVGLVFRAIGQRLQSVFEYAPGRSLDDPLPLVTFKADEWTDVGE